MFHSHRIFAAIIFSCSAVLSTFMIGYYANYIYMTPDQFLIFHILPGISAFSVSFIFAGKIQYTNSIHKNLPVCISISILIVIISLVLWVGLVFIFEGTAKVPAAMAFVAATYLGFLTYPFGVIAGLLVWWKTKHNNRLQDDAAAPRA